MPRGRPIKSAVRQNIVELLFFMKESYAYNIYKVYRSIFSPVTMRSIYYHLKKGTALGEFKVSQIKKEKGDFSWGNEVEKTYYALGPNAKTAGNDQVKTYFDKKQ